MYVVVVGMGEVGRHVVRELDNDGHTVIAIDSERLSLEEVEQSRDVGTLLGYGSSPRVLREAGVAQADLAVAVTDGDEVNLVAARIAKDNGAKRAIARVQGEHYASLEQGIHYDFMGLDVVLNPRILIAHEIAKTARSRGAIDVLGLAGNRVEMIQVELAASSKMLHKTLANLSLPDQTLIGAVVREGELFVPGGADVLLAGDRVYLLGRAGHMEQAERLFGGGRQAARVCIVGGGVIGGALARLLASSEVEVMLLERHRGKAEHLAEELPDVTVIHGDGTDLQLLEEEGAGRFDLFAAVTGDDEVNLMAGLLARRIGVTRTISTAHRPDYAEIYHQLGIDLVLSPRTVASENVLRYVRQDEVQSLTLLEHGQAEVIELLAREGSRVVGTPLRRLNLPRGALLACIVSGGEVRVPSGADQIHQGDVVVVVATAAARSAVERLFRKTVF